MPDPSSPIIRLQAITKVFHTEEIETHALSGVHLDIMAGDFTVIYGPSGCGKSTLLSLIGLLDTATSGNYWLKGVPASHLNPDQRAHIRNHDIGYIFQNFNLIGSLTVFENVELPLIYRRIPGNERVQRVMEALDRVEMTHRRNHIPSQLSGGQQQRIAVARALAGQPSILLADEPTGNLDSRNGEKVMDLLKSIHLQGSTLCMVTHETRFERLANRIITMLDGKIIEERHQVSAPL